MGPRHRLGPAWWPKASPGNLQRRAGWECSGWLDGEFAWVGDPAWDLTRMDVFRPKPLPPTPRAFYEGYGALPPEPTRSVYELYIQLWMAAQHVEGQRAWVPTYDAAWRYVGSLDEHIRAIGGLLGAPSRDTGPA
jgi:aminoglycoside phosphotransferase (APT) family kinase protein